jgi:hypothetical protein
MRRRRAHVQREKSVPAVTLLRSIRVLYGSDLSGNTDHPGVFANPSRQTKGHRLKLGRTRFCPYPTHIVFRRVRKIAKTDY